MPTPPTIPIRRLTLYKHGVAFVEREGAYEGQELALTFPAAAVNDALKSLMALEQESAERQATINRELATINVESTADTPA